MVRKSKKGDSSSRTDLLQVHNRQLVLMLMLLLISSVDPNTEVPFLCYYIPIYYMILYCTKWKSDVP